MKLIRHIPLVLLAGELYLYETWTRENNFHLNAIYPIRQIIYYETN